MILSNFNKISHSFESCYLIMKIEDLKIRKGIKLKKRDALIIVDIQNDFIPGGALPVEGGADIIDGINRIARRFQERNCIVVLTQDWHPKGHLSFASSHPGKNPGEEYSSEDGAIGPVLWPDHCVQGTNGAEFHKSLKVDFVSAIIRKGINPKVDSYSAFLENDKENETGLAGYLESLKVERIFLCGLALDYCVYYSAMDGMNFGFETFFIIDLTKGIDLPAGNISECLINMVEEEVQFVNQESFS